MPCHQIIKYAETINGRLWKNLNWEERVRFMKKDPRKILRSIKNQKQLGEKWMRMSKKNKLRYISRNPEQILKRLKTW